MHQVVNVGDATRDRILVRIMPNSASPLPIAAKASSKVGTARARSRDRLRARRGGNSRPVRPDRLSCSRPFRYADPLSKSTGEHFSRPFQVPSVSTPSGTLSTMVTSIASGLERTQLLGFSRWLEHRRRATKRASAAAVGINRW